MGQEQSSSSASQPAAGAPQQAAARSPKQAAAARATQLVAAARAQQHAAAAAAAAAPAQSMGISSERKLGSRPRSPAISRASSSFGSNLDALAHPPTLASASEMSSAALATPAAAVSAVAALNDQYRRQMAERHSALREETAARLRRVEQKRARAMRMEAAEAASVSAAAKAAELEKRERWSSRREAERKQMSAKANERRKEKAQAIVLNLLQQIQDDRSRFDACMRVQAYARGLLARLHARRERSALVQQHMNAMQASWIASRYMRAEAGGTPSRSQLGVELEDTDPSESE